MKASSLNLRNAVIADLGNKAEKTRRAAIVIPGFTPTAAVLRALYLHPEPRVRRRLKIGAVNVCVNPEDVFGGGKAPGAEHAVTAMTSVTRRQCGRGFVNNVVLTPPTECARGSKEEAKMLKTKVSVCVCV